MQTTYIGFSLLYELNAPSDKFKVFASVVPWSRKIAAENCPAQYENSEHSKNKRIVKAGYANSDKNACFTLFRKILLTALFETRKMPCLGTEHIQRLLRTVEFADKNGKF